MARVCAICGKGTMTGNKVSHSNIKTRRVWKANVHKRTIVDKKGKTVKAYICTRCLRNQKKEAVNA